jgi:hypothetical protein
LKTCIICEKAFWPRSTLQTVCGIRCSAKVAPKKRKEEAAKTRAQKEALKTLPELRKEAQDAFNAYIRARDAGKPCVCCGRYPQGSEALRGGQYDAGHYRSRGSSPELAFNERNCHAQLKSCNRYTWDVAGYRAELIRRIGLQQVEELEGSHPPKKYSREDLREIRETYKRKLKELQK